MEDPKKIPQPPVQQPVQPKEEKPKVDKAVLQTKIAEKEKLLSDKQIINK